MIRFFPAMPDSCKFISPLLLLILITVLPVSYSGAAETQQPKPSVGLVLSGGGAKGFAHIGTLRVLEEVDMPIDYITGTSMGSVVGGLYAIGYNSEELTDIALNTNWARLFADEVSRRNLPMEEKMWDGHFLGTLPIDEEGMRLPTGVMGGHQVTVLLSRLAWSVHQIHDFSELPIPFAAIATDIETGEVVVLDSGYLPEAMRASIAIPSIFQPIRIDGKYLVDGGLVRNMPVIDVIEMGADYTIGVNVSTQLQTQDRLRDLVSILNQTISIGMLANIREQEELADHMIRPELGDYTLQDFGSVEEIIQIGEEAARAHYDELKAIADSLNEERGEAPVRPQKEDTESVVVDEIRVTGLEEISEARVLRDFNLPTGSPLMPEDIEVGIERLYATPFFERITYRLTREDENYILTLNVVEAHHDEFNFGLRYDTRRRASLKFNLAFRNLMMESSSARVTLSLGEEISIDGHYFNYPEIAALDTRFGAQTRLNYTRYSTDIFIDRSRDSNVSTDAFLGEVMIGPLFSNLALISTGFRSEYFFQTSAVGDYDFPEGWSLYFSLFGDIWLDSLNRRHFPQVGQALRYRSDVSLPGIANTLAFSKHELTWEGYYRIEERWTIGHRIRAGQTFGDDLPLHHQLKAGHYPDAPGYILHQLPGSAFFSGQGLIRVEPWDDRFLALRAGLSNSFDQIIDPFDNEPLYVGWALEAGARTLVGPVKFAVTGSRHNPFLFEVKLGFEM